MSKERELLQKVLTKLNSYYYEGNVTIKNEIIELLAQPEQEQEPVAWQLVANFITDGDILQYTYSKPRDELYEYYRVTPLYTSPPKREPLSTKQAEDLWETSNFKSAVPYYIFDEICVAVERYHGIGGGE